MSLGAMAAASPSPLLERQTLCIAGPSPGASIHRGNELFKDMLQRHYSTPESNANERLVLLKTKLACVADDDFWTALLEGITNVLGAQISFVAKRVAPDDASDTVQMPGHGEPGSCMMAVAIYCNDGHEVNEHMRDHKYFSYGGPCAQMKHDKVFLVPSGLLDYAGKRAHEFKVPVDVYFGVPLASKGKVFAHFGAMWPTTVVEQRKLSLGFIEMAMHALEDIIAAKLLDGPDLTVAADLAPPTALQKTAISITRSLKPYAQSLSHELRTPMHGVVGMLDLMHASVVEALEAVPQSHMGKVFQTLRENIEVVQDSSQRAVEAADNVVLAYDLDMQVPSTPDNASVPGDMSPKTTARIPDLPQSMASKRKRSPSLTRALIEPIAKRRSQVGESSVTERIEEDSGCEAPTALGVIEAMHQQRSGGGSRPSLPQMPSSDVSQPSPTSAAAKPIVIRELVHAVVNGSLQSGGRPDAAITTATPRGEIIEVRARSSQGDASTKMVEWFVDERVPHEILGDERDITKLISALVLNALKFTKQGSVNVAARMSRHSRYLVVNVVDTGSGIPDSFRGRLFRPFSQEDGSLTRQSEGLGLGLLVAKGIARKMGGDINLVRSEIDGPSRGSEFELRVPLSPSDGRVRPGTPSRTPTPQPLESPLMSQLPDLHAFNWAPKSPVASPRAWERSGLAQSPPPRPRPPTNVPLAHSEGKELELTPAHIPNTGRPRSFDSRLSQKHPLRILVAEDNRTNRKLLVTMLSKLGYSDVQEAFDGAEAVRLVEANWRASSSDKQTRRVDTILMDLWMPNYDGYEATERILALENQLAATGKLRDRRVKILAVTADVTEGALERARAVGMEGLMTKPYKILDLERLIREHCPPVTME